MRILLYWNKKIRSFKDFDDMMKVLKLTKISDEARIVIERANRKGDILHGCINPYASEMGAGENPQPAELMVDADPEVLASRYWRLSAEI